MRLVAPRTGFDSALIAEVSTSQETGKQPELVDWPAKQAVCFISAFNHPPRQADAFVQLILTPVRAGPIARNQTRNTPAKLISR